MPTNDWRTGNDAGLEKLFAAAYRELPSEPFAEAVMRHIRRSARLRRLRAYVIGSAFAVGVGLAAGPLVDLLARVGTAAATIHWSAVDVLCADVVAATQMYRIPVLVVLLCALAWPALARFVAR